MAVVTIFNFDAVGNWTVGNITTGDDSAVAQNTTTKMEGTAALDLTVDVSTSAENRGQFQDISTSKNLSAVAETGYIRMWLYIDGTSYVTSIQLQFGSDDTNKYYGTITADAYGNAFHTGWNLLEWNWATISKNASPVTTALDWWYLLINYSASQGDTSFTVDYMHHDTEKLFMPKVMIV